MKMDLNILDNFYLRVTHLGKTREIIGERDVEQGCGRSYRYCLLQWKPSLVDDARLTASELTQNWKERRLSEPGRRVFHTASSGVCLALFWHAIGRARYTKVDSIVEPKRLF